MKRLVVASMIVLGLAGCGGSSEGGREAGLSTDRATPTETTGHDSDSGDSLIPTAQDAYDDYAAGDFGRSYDSWSAESQVLIGRDEYTGRIESCPAITTKIEATKASENDDGSWTVRWGLENYSEPIPGLRRAVNGASS